MYTFALRKGYDQFLQILKENGENKWKIIFKKKLSQQIIFICSFLVYFTYFPSLYKKQAYGLCLISENFERKYENNNNK